MKRPFTGSLILSALTATGLALAAGCASVGQMGEMVGQVGQGAGWITPEEAESLIRASAAVGKTFEDLTPENEYYIGRAVAASILERYPVWDDAAAVKYVNLVGQAAALGSSRPETFGGYHFQILDAGEVNAFAAPGGLVFVTRGMLRLCTTEDELAAVLAHEIGHVAGGHGLRSIKTGRLTSAAAILAAESGKQFGSDDLRTLTEAFEGSISDITDTLVNSGYARGLEKEADQAALNTLGQLGYDPHALLRVLAAMQKQVPAGGPGFGKTHPPASARATDIRALLGPATAATGNTERTRRFQQALAGI